MGFFYLHQPILLFHSSPRPQLLSNVLILKALLLQPISIVQFLLWTLMHLLSMLVFLEFELLHYSVLPLQHILKE